MKFYNLFTLCFLFLSVSTQDYEETWRNYPACHTGRLQSPINLNISDSIYDSTFSFVYQTYTNSASKIKPYEKNKPKNYASVSDEFNGGFTNFAKNGVIKQYKFIKAELYKGLHGVEFDKNTTISDYELHLVHKKVLDFKSNRNQHRTITDANMYLVVVLRYNKDTSCSRCVYDDGLLEAVTKDENFDLSKYPIFQDRRAYFYEGSFIYFPCDEDVNYYVVSDVFGTSLSLDNLIDDNWAYVKNTANSFGRPIYRNFMNFTENGAKNMKVSIISLIIMIFGILI